MLFAQAADVETVAEPRRRAIVTRGQDAPVADQDRADVAADAGGAVGNHPGDVHEIIIPCGPFRGAAPPSVVLPVRSLPSFRTLRVCYLFSRILSA